MPSQEAVQHVSSRGEDIPHIVKHGKTHVVLDEGQGWRGKAQLEVVEKQGRAAHRKSCLRVSRTGLIKSETTMGVAASHVKTFGQRNLGQVGGRRKRRVGKHSVAERVFKTHTGRAGKHNFFGGSSFLAKPMVRGILNQNVAKVGLRAEIAAGHYGIDGVVASASGFQVVITVIAEVTESGLSQSHG